MYGFVAEFKAIMFKLRNEPNLPPLKIVKSADLAGLNMSYEVQIYFQNRYELYILLAFCAYYSFANSFIITPANNKPAPHNATFGFLLAIPAIPRPAPAINPTFPTLSTCSL